MLQFGGIGIRNRKKNRKGGRRKKNGFLPPKESAGGFNTNERNTSVVQSGGYEKIYFPRTANRIKDDNLTVVEPKRWKSELQEKEEKDDGMSFMNELGISEDDFLNDLSDDGSVLGSDSESDSEEEEESSRFSPGSFFNSPEMGVRKKEKRNPFASRSPVVEKTVKESTTDSPLLVLKLDLLKEKCQKMEKELSILNEMKKVFGDNFDAQSVKMIKRQNAILQARVKSVVEEKVKFERIVKKMRANGITSGKERKFRDEIEKLIALKRENMERIGVLEVEKKEVQKKMDERVKMLNEKLGVKTAQFELEKSELKNSLESRNLQHAEAQKLLESVKTEKVKLEKKNEELSAKYSRLNLDGSELRKKNSKFAEELSRMELEVSQKGSEISTMKKTLDNLFAEKTSLEKEKEESAERMQVEKESLVSKAMKLEKEVVRERAEKTKLEETCRRLTKKVGEVEQEKIDLESMLEGLKKKEMESDVDHRTQLEGLRNELKGKEESMGELGRKLEEMSAQCESVNEVKNSQDTQIEDLKKCLVKEREGRKYDVEKASEEMVAVRTKLEVLKISHAKEIEKLRKENEEKLAKGKIVMEDSLRKQGKSFRDKFEKFRSELGEKLKKSKEDNVRKHSTLEKKNSKLEQSLQAVSKQLASVGKRKKQLEREIEKLQKLRAQDVKTRKRLHNQIMELKGNIRVFCRCRPLLSTEKESTDQIIKHLTFSESGIKVIERGLTNVRGESLKPKVHSFEFDRIFSPSATQVNVFNEIDQLVQSALDGQTGTGKTYTMEGDEKGSENARGMIHRSVEKIFSSIKSTDGEWEIKASFLEIYNEKLRDLLEPKDPTKVKMEIKHHPDGFTEVTNLKYVVVDSLEKVSELIHMANKERAKGSTLANERSSRSHSVFSLDVRGKSATKKRVTRSTLHLIDLAGSERLSTSGSSGDRMIEATFINKSLSALGNVMEALDKKRKTKKSKSHHIPFRDSKLTFFLKNALGGNSKCLMFCQVSPLVKNLGESVNTLRFASKVNSIELGKAKKRFVK